MKLRSEYMFCGLIALTMLITAAAVVAQVVIHYGVWALAALPAPWVVNAVGRLVVWGMDRKKPEPEPRPFGTYRC